LSLYLTSIYADEEKKEKFERECKATGKRYDVGKSCVRFRKLDDLPLDVVADVRIWKISSGKIRKHVLPASGQRAANKTKSKKGHLFDTLSLTLFLIFIGESLPE